MNRSVLRQTMLARPKERNEQVTMHLRIGFSIGLGVSSAPSVFLLSSPVLGSWVNQERVVKRETDGLVSLKVGFLGR